MQLTKTDIKRAIQSEMTERGYGRGWKKIYSLSESKTRLRDLHDVDTAADVIMPGQIIHVEAVTSNGIIVNKQRWVEFCIGEDRIWAREDAIEKKHLNDDHLIFER
jgi:hypothetical protein